MRLALSKEKTGGGARLVQNPPSRMALFSEVTWPVALVFGPRAAIATAPRILGDNAGAWVQSGPYTGAAAPTGGLEYAIIHL